MTDFLLLEQLHKMMMEIPKPRLMFKKGAGVKGFFRPYMSFADYTEAEIFKSLNEITPVLGRFSLMLGDRGTADTSRNIKGLAVKFHGSDGDYDLICQNLPVFFINKIEKFMELSEALTVKDRFDKINSEKFWQFIVSNPEAVNCAIRLFSHEGLSDSFVYERWYSVNTYIWKNKNGEKFLVRYKWEPVTEDKDDHVKSSKRIDRTFAEFMAGFDPDRATDDMERYIGEGKFPSFELKVQMVNYKYISHPNYLKRTMYWNEAVNPSIAIGIMKITELLKKPREQEENACFAPGNTVKGIELCGDEFSMIMNYAHKMGAAERGGKP